MTSGEFDLWKGRVETSGNAACIPEHFGEHGLLNLQPSAAEGYNDAHIYLRVWIQTCRSVLTHSDLEVSEHVVGLQRSTGQKSWLHCQRCEILRGTDGDLSDADLRELECLHMDAPVLVHIPGQMQLMERGSTCLTDVPSHKWLISSNEVDLVGSESIQRRGCLPRRAFHKRTSEIVRGKTERIGVKLPDRDLVRVEDGTHQVVKCASRAMDEVTKDDTDVSSGRRIQALVDDLVSLFGIAIFGDRLKVTFYPRTDFSIQGFEVERCAGFAPEPPASGALCIPAPQSGECGHG